MKKMTGAQIVIESLLAEGVDTIFGYPGGTIFPTYDALRVNPAIRHILVRHEQGATHLGEGYARVSGRPDVVLVTSGPGATNTITGIADAYMDWIIHADRDPSSISKNISAIAHALRAGSPASCADISYGFCEGEM
jgi:glyoxylate carboligase